MSSLNFGFRCVGNWAVIIFLIVYRAIAASKITRTENFVRKLNVGSY